MPKLVFKMPKMKFKFYGMDPRFKTAEQRKPKKVSLVYFKVKN